MGGRSGAKGASSHPLESLDLSTNADATGLSGFFYDIHRSHDVKQDDVL
jgi:hypothetical protein